VETALGAWRSAGRDQLEVDSSTNSLMQLGAAAAILAGYQSGRELMHSAADTITEADSHA